MTIKTRTRDIHEPKLKLYPFQIYKMLEAHTLSQQTCIVVTKPFWQTHNSLQSIVI